MYLFILFKFQLFDLGQIKGSEVDHKGTISIPNLSDENTPDEIEVCAKALG